MKHGVSSNKEEVLFWHEKNFVRSYMHNKFQVLSETQPCNVIRGLSRFPSNSMGYEIMHYIV